MSVDMYADNFGTAPGLEVSLKHIEGGLVVVSCSLNARRFEGYAPTTPERAAEAAKYLIQGLQAPRALFRRDEHAR